MIPFIASVSNRGSIFSYEIPIIVSVSNRGSIFNYELAFFKALLTFLPIIPTIRKVQL
jgi:hypothetical protein